MSTAPAGTRRAPFAHLRPAFLAAAAYAVALIVWLGFGDGLPGGRWFAVHLFTVGILTNLVVALTAHFAQTVLHAPGEAVRPARFAVLNAGALLLLAGRAGVGTAAFALGGTLLTGAVTWLYADLRRLRKQALTARFAYVVRTYERACGAFAHGATLGVLLGVGWLSGAWYGAARLAHLHVTVLGWGGLTLLATVLFFGPTVMRVRMHPGAEDAAVPALRRAATALTAAAFALLLTGLGGAWGTGLRLLAAVALAVYAFAATGICRHVLLAGAEAKPSVHAWMVRAACGWFITVAWADVVVVAFGRPRLLDGLGILLLVGVLGQAILAAAGHLAPMLVPGGPEARGAARARLDRAPRTRVLALNVGVVLVVVAALVGPGAGPAGAAAILGGWVLVAASLVAHLALTAVGTLRRVAA
jgi:hypothetical protein